MPKINEGNFIEVNGINMYYEKYGSGPPLILLHGGTGTGQANWKEHIPNYAKHFQVYIPDSRGHGRTNNPSRELSYPIMGEDYSSFIQALGLEKPSICGWSDGGQVALELGMKDIELGAMIVGGAHSSFSENIADAFQPMGIEGPGKVNFKVVKKAVPDRVERWETIHDNWQDTLVDVSKLWLTHFSYTKNGLSKFSTPTLVLLGDRDQFIEVEEAVNLYKMIPNSELAILHNSNHSVSLTNVELFSSTALEFLLRHNNLGD